MIKCLPILVNIDYCLECNKTTPYMEGYCIYCHSAAPLGDPYDMDISDEEWELYFKEKIIVGNINEMSDDILYIINNL